MKIRIQTGASDRKEFMEVDELVPCPKCHETEPPPHLYYEPQGQGGGYGDYYVRCGYCHQKGPAVALGNDTQQARLHAITDWNDNEGWRDRVKRLFAR